MRSRLRLAAWAGLSCLAGLLIAGAYTAPDPETVAAMERFFGQRNAIQESVSLRSATGILETADKEYSVPVTVDPETTSAIPENALYEERPPGAAEAGVLLASLRPTFEDGLDGDAPLPSPPLRLAPESLTALSATLEDEAAEAGVIPAAVRPGYSGGSFLGILAGAKRSGGADKGLSLPQALAQARIHNTEIGAARAELRALGESVPQARAAMRPNLFGTVKAGSVLSGASFDDSLSRADTVSLGIEASQKLFDGFQARNNVAAAKAQVSAARNNLANLEQNIVYSAATAYMDVLRDRQIAALRRQNMKFLDEQVRAAQDRFDIGEATRTDVAQANSQHALASAMLSSALADLDGSEALFERIIGAPPRELRLASVPKSLLPANLKEAQAIAQREHPSIIASRYTADAALALAKSAQGALLPSVNLTAALNDSFALNSPAAIAVGQTQDKVEAAIGVKLTIPLYQGGGASSRVRQAKEVMGQRRIEADESRLKVRAAVSTSWAQLKAAEANAAGFQARVTASQLALEGVIEEQGVGQRTTLDVLNANDQVISGKILLLGAQRNLVVASYALISAVGRLSAETASSAPSNIIVRNKAKKDDWQRMRQSTHAK